MRLRLTRRAQKQLESISDYLTREAGEDVAARMRRRFDEAFNRLLVVPHAGRPSTLRPEMREWLVSSYRVYYEAAGEEIIIARVYHQRQHVTPEDFG